MQKPLEGTESKKVEDKKKDFVQNIDKKFENGKMCEPWAEQVFFKYKTQNYFCL